MATDYVTFQQVKFYYPNLIDYVRLAMCIAATCVIPQDVPILTGFLIFGSILLDWIDGPVARAYQQCSLIGEGIDWICDLFGQLLLTLWWCYLEPKMLPWIGLATMIEIGNAMVDFAITACDRYPPRGKAEGFLIILQWAIPHGRYTRFGTFLWIAHPLYIVARCLNVGWLNKPDWIAFLLDLSQYAFFLPAIIYIWGELALLIANLNRWNERKTRPAISK